jgi:NUMOD4 motif
MIRPLSGESWKQLNFSGWKKQRNRYAVSNRGRLASYKMNLPEDGKLLNGSLTTGYRTLNLHRPGEKGTLYLHREIAKLFLKKPSRNHRYVIHLNHKKQDNNTRNLRWVTAEEMTAHQQKSPGKIAYRKIQAKRTIGMKLTATQVKQIKKIIGNPKRTITMKKLAARYKISEMTLYRIKSGENWGRI